MVEERRVFIDDHQPINLGRCRKGVMQIEFLARLTASRGQNILLGTLSNVISSTSKSYVSLREKKEGRGELIEVFKWHKEYKRGLY